MRNFLLLPRLRAGEDLSLLLLRTVTGAFLVHGVWDNISSAGRMDEFVGFLAQNRFVYPELMARLSVWTQFACGLGMIAGLLTRWSGLLCVANFVVACVMVHWQQDFRGWWPALALVLIGVLLTTRGGGRFSADRVLLGDRPT
jgi:putative oxidoreductase